MLTQSMVAEQFEKAQLPSNTQRKGPVDAVMLVVKGVSIMVFFGCNHRRANLLGLQ